MSDIQVGDFVRTISGNIDKVDALYGMIENTVHLENHKWQSIKNITKHSPNLIDLIEIEDIVEVLDNGNGDKEIVYIFDESMIQAIKEDIENKEIEFVGICTHEQFNSVMYKVKE